MTLKINGKDFDYHNMDARMLIVQAISRGAGEDGRKAFNSDQDIEVVFTVNGIPLDWEAVTNQYLDGISRVESDLARRYVEDQQSRLRERFDTVMEAMDRFVEDAALKAFDKALNKDLT